jgi:signal transduction histidine kinase
LVFRSPALAAAHPTESSRDDFTSIEAGFAAPEATVNDLLSFTSHRQPRWQSFLVCALVEEVCDALAEKIDAQCVELDVDVPPNTVLTADRELIRRAVVDLMLNALAGMPRGGDLVITSYEGSRGFELEIADSGPGLSSEAKKRLFEPANEKLVGDTGPKLSAVFQVAEAHGGMVTAANCPEGGAAFTLRIPRRRAARAAA